MKSCKVCSSDTHTAFLCPKRARKPLTTKKRLNNRGKKVMAYEHWRDTVAKPYLDRTYGHVCATVGCEETDSLDVDHVLNRGSRPDLVMDLTNVQYLCRQHHYEKTFHIR